MVRPSDIRLIPIEVLEGILGCSLQEAPDLLTGRGSLASSCHGDCRARQTRPGAAMNDERPAFAGLSQAAEGTRTLDLLHGKQTL